MVSKKEIKKKRYFYFRKIQIAKKGQHWLDFFDIMISEVKSMLVRKESERNTLEMVSVEGLVPKDHLLRKIDSAVDFTHIYDSVEDLYSPNNGRPSVDPVVLFKMVLIQHLYGIPSLRRNVEEINMNIAYSWFLGYLLNEPVPHFATISYNFRHRFSEDTIEKILHGFFMMRKEADICHQKLFL